MTVMARNTEPVGTYTEGYDQGALDATERAPRKYKRPTSRQRNASAYRFGYADGYADHVAEASDSEAAAMLNEALG